MKLQSLKTTITQLFAITILLTLVGCASQPQPAAPPPSKPAGPDMSARPEWTRKIPEPKDGRLFFKGTSAIHALETRAQDDAYKNASDRVVAYMGNIVQNKLESLAVSYGLSSEIVDPTTSTREYKKQLAQNVLRQLKRMEDYPERNPEGGWVVHTLTYIPIDFLNKTFEKTAKENMEAAKQRAKKAKTEQARQQEENAARMWGDAAKQGITEFE